MSAKERLDRLLWLRGLAPSREQARGLILAGAVSVEGRVVTKAGSQVDSEASISLAGPTCPFVSRGGVKLEGALRCFQVPVEGRNVLDVGASTGGFTDCLLQRGTRRVIALDVGRGQLEWKLRQDPRVIVMEGRNIRFLKKSDLPIPVDLAVIDVSFISLEIVLPAVVGLLTSPQEIVALVKPQFEVGKGKVGKGGVVRDPQQHRQVLERLVQLSQGLGLQILGVCVSALRGPKGNREFFLYLKGGAGGEQNSEKVVPQIAEAVRQAWSTEDAV